MRARAIVMPLPRAAAAASLFGKTLETVLAERPCRVIIESVAGDGARRAPRRTRTSRRGRATPEPRRSIAPRTRVLSVAMIAARRRAASCARWRAGGGPLAVGILLGVLFVRRSARGRL